jgi:HlyD family secretion protein
MRVKLLVNEALVQYVKKGLPATVHPIGMESADLHGQVTSINRYAEPGNWRKADVKEYRAYVLIEEEVPGLRTGMTVSVTVKCDFIPNTLQLPVQAVHPHGEDFYCLVRNGNDWEPRKLKVGPTNTEFFVIEEGINEGDMVAMNPRQYVASVELPDLPPAKQRPSVVPEIEAAEEAVAETTEPVKPTATAAAKSRTAS